MKRTHNSLVVGSNPTGPIFKWLFYKNLHGFLLHLVVNGLSHPRSIQAIVTGLISMPVNWSLLTDGYKSIGLVERLSFEKSIHQPRQKA